MSLGTRTRILGLVLFAGQLLAGCAQDTPESLTFSVPTLTIDISSDDSEWRSAPAKVVPNIVCAGPEAVGDCCTPPAPLPPVECGQYPLACDPMTNYCAVIFDVSSSVNVDLESVPAVAAIDGRAWSGVRLRSLTASVTGLPALPIRSALLYVAPIGTAGAGGAETALLGPVTLDAKENATVPVDSEGQEAFAALARDYRMPFMLSLVAHVVVANGLAPTGTVSFGVTISAQAIY